MRRLAFRVPEVDKEAVLDALLPLLPAGVREEEGEGWVELSSCAGALPDRGVLEAAAGRALEAFGVEDVPADWRQRRARFGGGGVLVRDRVLIRPPGTRPRRPGWSTSWSSAGAARSARGRIPRRRCAWR